MCCPSGSYLDWLSERLSYGWKYASCDEEHCGYCSHYIITEGLSSHHLLAVEDCCDLLAFGIETEFILLYWLKTMEAYEIHTTALSNV